jgi:hypothetical protein
MNHHLFARAYVYALEMNRTYDERERENDDTIYLNSLG